MRTGILPILSFSLLPFSLTADPVSNFWFNGAELNRYEITQSRYGKAHPGHAELIYVTEPFLIAEQVKREFGGKLATDVLKLNALRTFNTGLYSYRTMTSTFSPIDLETYPHALKTNTSVQDWCGQAFQQINRIQDGWAVELRSYFQAAGDTNTQLKDSWLEDELWVRLRLDPGKLPTGEIEVVPGAVHTRFAHLPIRAVTAEAKLFTDQTTSLYALRYASIGRTLEIEFDTAFPHIIRAWKEIAPDGTSTAKLSHREMNVPYWNQNQPADSSKRKALGLDPVAN
ncbi:MAG: hypothetical protein ACPGKS_01160 [Coraliomargarita sp.]